MRGKRISIPVGTRFGNLITTSEVEVIVKNNHRYGYVSCECQCSKHTNLFVNASRLIRGDLNSCGCLRHESIRRGFHLTAEQKAKLSSSMKKAHKEKRAHNIGESHWKGYPSPSEKEFKSIIEELFSDKLVIPEMQFHLFNLDFAWPHKKKCIELDGEQHFRFESYRQRDERKNVALAKEGWQIMRIPLTEFYGHKESTISKANEFIGAPYSNAEYEEAMKVYQEEQSKRKRHRNLEYDKRRRKNKKESTKEKSVRIKKRNYCPDCGKEISSTAKRCLECNAKSKYKIQWPNKETLERMFVESTSLEALSRKLGVASHAIKKHMNQLGIVYVAKEHKGNPENFRTPEARAKNAKSTREYARLHPKKMEHRIGRFTKEGELIKIYDYQKDLQADGFNRWSPSKVARGVLKSYKGYDWRFMDQMISMGV